MGDSDLRERGADEGGEAGEDDPAVGGDEGPHPPELRDGRVRVVLGLPCAAQRLPPVHRPLAGYSAFLSLFKNPFFISPVSSCPFRFLRWPGK